LPGLLLRQGLVLDAEEALEAAQPHLELEEVAGLPRGADLLQPLAHPPAQELGARLGAVLGARVLRAHSARALSQTGLTPSCPASIQSLAVTFSSRPGPRTVLLSVRCNRSHR